MAYPGNAVQYVDSLIFFFIPIASSLFTETNNMMRCKFRLVDCRRGCGASIIARELDSHEQDHCRLSKHPCVFGCGEKITKAKMDAHTKKVTGGKKEVCAANIHSGARLSKIIMQVLLSPSFSELSLCLVTA